MSAEVTTIWYHLAIREPAFELSYMYWWIYPAQYRDYLRKSGILRMFRT